MYEVRLPACTPARAHARRPEGAQRTFTPNIEVTTSKLAAANSSSSSLSAAGSSFGYALSCQSTTPSRCDGADQQGDDACKREESDRSLSCLGSSLRSFCATGWKWCNHRANHGRCRSCRDRGRTHFSAVCVTKYPRTPRKPAGSFRKGDHPACQTRHYRSRTS